MSPIDRAQEVAHGEMIRLMVGNSWTPEGGLFVMARFLKERGLLTEFVDQIKKQTDMEGTLLSIPGGDTFLGLLELPMPQRVAAVNDIMKRAGGVA